jgi:phenylacetic acid degradation operon negative regulatory protein
MSESRNRPADVVLDLLRSVGQRGHSVRFLVDAGGLFGFSENTVRVTLSRLVSRGLLESPARGRYRLARRADPVNAFVERWRDGEGRRRPWTPGHWLLAHLVDADAHSRWVLESLGLREVRAGLLARPDNLDLDLAGLRRLATGMGLADSVLLAVAEPEDGPVPAGWLEAWRPEVLAAGYDDLLRRLRESAARLADLPRDRGRLESFRLGGEVIHCLAKDPLLPPELLDATTRETLWREMLDYDALGKRVWAGTREGTPGTLPIPQLESTDTRDAK